MSHTLSSAEFEQISRAIQLLISPLDHATVDAWRLVVNRQLKALLHADSAGFLLPVPDGLLLYSEEHDPAELARYPDYPPPPLTDGRTLWKETIRKSVSTLRAIYGDEFDRYFNSPYNQEYAGANGAHDPLLAAHFLGGNDARGMACLHFWHERPTGRLFGEREVAILRMLHPAFRAGVEMVTRWGGHRVQLLDALDALGQAAMVFDLTGRPLHQTPALTALLAADPEAPTLRAEIDAAMTGLCCVLRARASRGSNWTACPGVSEVRTAYARYEVRALLYGDEPRGSSATILISLERRTPVPSSEAELRELYGLMRAEVRVARLIAQGHSNAEIADALFISPHTARRHTERILQKLNVRSRSGVASKVLC